MLPDHFRHVAVLFADFRCDGSRAVFSVERIGDSADFVFAAVEREFIVVAQNVLEFRQADCSRTFHQVVESLESVGQSGNFSGRKHGIEFRGDFEGVDHDSFCGTGMHGAPADENFRFGCVEILKFNFICRSAVDRVGILRSESGNVKEIRTFPDLLVRCECNAERTVRQLLCLNGFEGGHNLRNSRLVVGSEQSCSIGCDERVPDEVFHERIECCVEFQSGRAETDGRAVPVPDDLRTDVCPACTVGGVHVGDESEGVGMFESGCRGQLRVDVAFGCHAHIFEFERAQLFCKMFRKFALFRG